MGGGKSKCTTLPPFEHQFSSSEFRVVQQAELKTWKNTDRERAGFDPRISCSKTRLENMLLQPWVCQGRHLLAVVRGHSEVNEDWPTEVGHRQCRSPGFF